MAETIISQLDRAFAMPLEVNRSVNFISDRDAISPLKRWEGMLVYVKSDTTTYELKGGILNSNWTASDLFIGANYTPNGGYAGTAQDIVNSIQTITGGVENISITHIANLDYYVIADPYRINGNYYSAAPTTVTLTVGDATNARIDVIYADINGLIGVLAGTPAATPVKPIVSNSQRELTFRTVPALATVDPTVTNELVFNENTGLAGGEFEVAGWNLVALNFNSTAVAFSGTKSIYFDGVDPYFNVDFKNDVNIAVSGLSTFFFRIYVTELLDVNASFFFHCLDTSFTANGNLVTVKDGLYGFDRNVLNAWQLISIPISAFNLTVTEIKGIKFMVSSIKKPKMYLDTLNFQSNLTQPTPTVSPYELLANKQNALTADGTGAKYPTVDAVNAGLGNKVDKNTAIVGATKTKITYDAKGLVTSGADATTADIADSLNKRYVSDAERTAITHTNRAALDLVSGTNTGDQDLAPYELLSNKKLDIEANKLSDVFYAPIKRIYDWAVGLFISGSGTQDFIPRFGVGGKVVGNSQIIDNGTNVGIGMTSSSKLTIAKSYDGNADVLALINSIAASVGSVNEVISLDYFFDNSFAGKFQVGKESDFTISANKNSFLAIYTVLNGVGGEKFRITSQGNGKFTGSVQVSDNTAVASAALVGARRYRESGNNSYIEVCMRTGASTYIWETLTVHSW